MMLSTRLNYKSAGGTVSTDNRKIKAVIFDLDNTLTDFMLAKRNAILAAADAMIDTGLQMDQKTVYDTIFKLYDEIGIEHQRVFNKFLEQEVGTVEDKVLAPIKEQYPEFYSWIVDWKRRQIQEMVDMELTERMQRDE